MAARRQFVYTPLPGLRPKVAYAGKRFNAWWEGYAFDPAYERRATLIRQSRKGMALGTTSDQADLVAETIWGPGRLEPGNVSWMAHISRALMIDTKASVLVYGAGRGGPIQDLRRTAHWSLTGYGRRASTDMNVRVTSYDRARRRAGRPRFQGGMLLFDLHTDPEPVTLMKMFADMIQPGGKAILVDYSVERRDLRLRGAFQQPWTGLARPVEDYRQAAEQAGFTIGIEIDETSQFMPLVENGWAGWRSAVRMLNEIKDNRERAALMAMFSRYAGLWADRYEAMEAGLLRVSRLTLEKTG